MFSVERFDFISRLWDLTKSRSVVLTGSPGVGKTWTIGQIVTRCKKENRKYLSLAAEDFEVQSIEELRKAIGFKNDLLSVLKSFGSESLLIIDGLDALRGESSQRAFRELIRSVIDQVPSCAVVVTVRSFDLQQSPELQTLFFNVHNERSFESVTTPTFSDDELQVAAEQVSGLKSVLEGANQTDIRPLLRNPFNLRLAVNLLEAGTGIEELTGIHSQVQLLQKYWFARVDGLIDGLARKSLLRHVVREMVSTKALSIREEAIYTSEHASVLKGLRSSEVLRESVTDRIAFSHNILFDYAVARLLLDENEVIGFLNADPSRIIFFRPSVLHFFHHLWWNDRNAFWNVSSRFFTTVELPERAKIIPAVVITEASRSLSDIETLWRDHNVARYGVPLTLRAVQALGSLQTTRRALWLDALATLSLNVRLEFINEFVVLLGIINESRVKREDFQIGAISRRLLSWMWQTASVLPKYQSEQLTNVAAARVMPVVMQLYATDPVSSRELVQSALARLGTPSSSPKDAFWIAHEIKHIIDNDPELARIVYERMFSSPDESEETTVMGGTPVFTMTSTRKQDFDTALYGLRQAFSYFLENAPIEASRAAVRVTNAEILRREITQHHWQDKKRRFTFRFLKMPATYISDYSEIWDHGAREYLSIQLLDAVLQRFGDNDGPPLKAIVQVIAQDAEVAVCWKRLLEISTGKVKTFFPYIKHLLFVPRLLAAPEVTIVAGNVLKAAYTDSLPDDSDKKEIESAITRIPRSRYVKRYETAQSIQSRLLLCIGVDRLLSPELRAKAESALERQPAFANRPYVRSTFGAVSYSTEDWLRDQGSDTGKEANRVVLDAIKSVTDFEHKYLNSEPTLDECRAAEPHLRQLHELIQTGQADENVSAHARGVLYAAVESALKNARLSEDPVLLAFFKNLLLEGTTDPTPTYSAEDHFDMPAWGSPLARIEAAQGVSHFIWNFGLDPEVVGAASKLSEDKVPAVRFQITVGLPGFYKHHDEAQFWHLMTRMIDAETTAGVMLGLVEALGRVAGADPERVVTLLVRAADRGLPSTDRNEVTRALVQILTELFVVRDHKAANEQLARFEAEPVRYASEIANEIFTASHYLIPNNAETGARSRARVIFSRVLQASYAGLQRASDIVDTDERLKAVNALLRQVDEVATRIYFSFDLKTELRVPEQTLAEGQQKQLYFELKPLLASLAAGSGAAQHHLLPHTAHYLLETFNGVLEYDPGEVIKYAALTCKAASGLDYQFDPMAISEVVKLVESSLADFKMALKDSSVATALGELLDLFVRAGWPEALRLTFKMDEAVR